MSNAAGPSRGLLSRSKRRHASFDATQRPLLPQALLSQSMIGPSAWNPTPEDVRFGLEDDVGNPRRQLSAAEVASMIVSLKERLGRVAESYARMNADIVGIASERLGVLEGALKARRIRVFHRTLAGAYAVAGSQTLPAISAPGSVSGVISLFVSSATTAHAPADDLQALLGLFHEGLEITGSSHGFATLLEGLFDPDLSDEDVDPNRVGLSPRFRAQLVLMNDHEIKDFTAEYELGVVEDQIRAEVASGSLPEPLLEYALAHARTMCEEAKLIMINHDSREFGLEAMNLLKREDLYVVTDLLTGQYRLEEEYQRQQVLGELERLLSERENFIVQVLGAFAQLADSSHQEFLLEFADRSFDIKAQCILVEALGRIGTSDRVVSFLRASIGRTEPDVYNEDQWFFFYYRDRARELRASLKEALRQLMEREFEEGSLELDLDLIEDQETRSAQMIRWYSWRRGLSLAGGIMGTLFFGSYLTWVGVSGSIQPWDVVATEESATAEEEDESAFEFSTPERPRVRRDLSQIYVDLPPGAPRPFIDREIVPLLKPFQVFDPVTNSPVVGDGDSPASVSVSRRERGISVLSGSWDAGLFIAEIRNGLGGNGEFERFGPIQFTPSGRPTGEFVEQILVTGRMRAGQRIQVPLFLDGRYHEASSYLGGFLSLEPNGWLAARRYLDAKQLKLFIERMSQNARIEASQPDTPWLLKELKELRENPYLAPIHRELVNARGNSLEERGETLIRLSKKYLGYSRDKSVRLDLGVVNSWMDVFAEIIDREGRFYADCDVLHTIVFIWARDLRVDAVYAIGLLNSNGDAVLTDQEGHAALIVRLAAEDSGNPWQMLDVTELIPQRTNPATMMARVDDPIAPVPAAAPTVAAAGPPYRSRESGRGAVVDANRFVDPTQPTNRAGRTTQLARRSPKPPHRTPPISVQRDPSGQPSALAAPPPDKSRAFEADDRRAPANQSGLFDPARYAAHSTERPGDGSDSPFGRSDVDYMPGIEKYIDGSMETGEIPRDVMEEEERELLINRGPEWYRNRLVNIRVALSTERQYPNANTHVEVQALFNQRTAQKDLSPGDERLLLDEVSRELGIERFQQPEKIEVLEKIIEIGDELLAEASEPISADQVMVLSFDTNAGPLAIRVRQETIDSSNRSAMMAEVTALVDKLGSGRGVRDVESLFEEGNLEKVLLVTARNENGELIGINLAHSFSLVDRDSFTWLSYRVATTSANLGFPGNVLLHSFIGVHELWRGVGVERALTDTLISLGKSKGYAYMLSETKLHVDFENQTTNTYLASGGFVIGHTFEDDNQGFLNQYFVPFQKLEDLEKRLPEYSGVRVLKKMAFGRSRLFSFFWENQEVKPKLLYVVISDPAADRKVTSFWLHEGNRLEQESQYPELRGFDLAIANNEAG